MLGSGTAATPTFGSIIAMPGERPTGFDYLRLALAILILASHTIDVSYGIAYGIAYFNGPLRPFMAILVPMFFALSGFLVGGSLERSRTLVSFTGLRVIRLMPALAAETALAALLLGPLLTTLPLTEYFQDPKFLQYFKNIFADTHYLLPGLFEANPWPRTVNAQLWTLPFEVGSYAALIGLALIGIHRNRLLFAALIALINVLMIARYVTIAEWNPNPGVPGSVLMICFLFGFTLNLFKDQIRHSHSWGIASAIITLILLIHPVSDYFIPPFVAYLTVYLGLTRPAPNALISHGDYSYGIYVYGFPVQQAVTQLLGSAGHHWYWNLVVSLPFTIGLAMLSWHWVEAPALGLRNRLTQYEDQWMVLKAGLSSRVMRDKLARP
jgi:peptidoglycan/LPS O-acetylase OafA/YrhL